MQVGGGIGRLTERRPPVGGSVDMILEAEEIVRVAPALFNL